MYLSPFGHILICVYISEMLALLKLAYGENAVKKLSVFDWHRWFKEG
jgi:hypothetical protein